MSRRERKKQEVSLFPFLDILACVIGNLILIITAVVLEQVDTKPMAEVVDRESNLAKVAEQEKQIVVFEEKLKSLLAANRKANKQLEEIEQQIGLAKNKLEEARNQLSRVPKNIPRVDEALVNNKVLLQKKKQEIEEAISKISADIAARKKNPERSIALLPAMVTPFQAHSLIPRSGMFVEVHKAGITIFPAKQFWTGKQAKQVPSKAIAEDTTLETILQAAFKDANKIVVLLVRPDALDTYQAAKSRFDRFQQAHVDELEQKIFNNPKSPLFSAELTPLRQRKLYSKIPLPGEGVLPIDEMSL